MLLWWNLELWKRAQRSIQEIQVNSLKIQGEEQSCTMFCSLYTLQCLPWISETACDSVFCLVYYRQPGLSSLSPTKTLMPILFSEPNPRWKFVSLFAFGIADNDGGDDDDNDEIMGPWWLFSLLSMTLPLNPTKKASSFFPPTICSLFHLYNVQVNLFVPLSI